MAMSGRVDRQRECQTDRGRAQQRQRVVAFRTAEQLAQREVEEDGDDQQPDARHQKLAAEADGGDLRLRRGPDAAPDRLLRRVAFLMAHERALAPSPLGYRDGRAV